jgi:hypothetical protein
VGTLSATSLLAAAQLAVDHVASFEIAVKGHNFVLPQWGGVDGGTVTVTRGGTSWRFSRGTATVSTP